MIIIETIDQYQYKHRIPKVNVIISIEGIWDKLDQQLQPRIPQDKEILRLGLCVMIFVFLL